MSLNAIIYVGVGYLGQKPFKKDTIYGTNLTWTPGMVQPVASQIANQMAYRHPDVYALEESERWQKFIAGELDDEPVNQEPVKTLDELISEKLAGLAKELRNLPRIELVEAHELVKELEVKFDTDDKRADKEQKILDAYKAYLLANHPALQSA